MKRILVVIDYYVPAFKAGGPVRSVANMIEALGTEADFHVFTNDHDLGDSSVLPGVQRDAWQRVGAANVYYTSKSSALGRIVREIQPDLIYCNSLFSRFALRTLVLRKLGRLDVPVVLAPRGELASGALQYGRTKKSLFLAFARLMKAYEDVTWQATSAEEVDEIQRRAPAKRKRVVLTSLFTSNVQNVERAPKAAGEAKIIFASRISPKKNLEMLLRVASRLRCRTTVDIFGPIGDREYWARCRRAIDALPSHVTASHRGALPLEKLQCELASSDLFVLPTHGENHGHAIVEALAARCPVLISDRTPWRGLESKSAGWDFPLTDDAQFVTTIERIAAMSDEEHRRWRDGAAAYAASVARREDAVASHRELFGL